MNPRISMITLGVSDLEKSIKFYKEGLGFPRMASPPEIAFFTLNGSWLGLYNRESLAEDATVSPEGSGFNGFTLSHNVASESNVDQIIGQAVSVGATLVKQPQKVFWGGTPAISKIQMATYGRLLTILTSGLALKMKMHNNALQG